MLYDKLSLITDRKPLFEWKPVCFLIMFGNVYFHYQYCYFTFPHTLCVHRGKVLANDARAIQNQSICGSEWKIGGFSARPKLISDTKLVTVNRMTSYSPFKYIVH